MAKGIKVVVKPETQLGVVLKHPKVLVRVPDGISIVANTLTQLQILEQGLITRCEAVFEKAAFPLSGLSYSIPTENIQKSLEWADVIVRDPAGSEVSVLHRYTGEALVFESNSPMDGLTAYI